MKYTSWGEKSQQRGFKGDGASKSISLRTRGHYFLKPRPQKHLRASPIDVTDLITSVVFRPEALEIFPTHGCSAGASDIL